MKINIWRYWHVQKINKWGKNQIGAYEVFVKNFDKLKKLIKKFITIYLLKLIVYPLLKDTQAFTNGLLYLILTF
ncbi:MAG: hypothetical protein CM15mP122_5450 [Bacteroidota bacterium]|nr:MAG: hypothetical protein CM15mP122_5450 [Bacteroidota bacterium]